MAKDEFTLKAQRQLSLLLFRLQRNVEYVYEAAYDAELRAGRCGTEKRRKDALR